MSQLLISIWPAKNNNACDASQSAYQKRSGFGARAANLGVMAKYADSDRRSIGRDHSADAKAAEDKKKRSAEANYSFQHKV